MVWQLNGYAVALWITAAIAGGVSLSAWKRRPKTGALPLTIVMAAVAWWALAQGLEVSVADVPGKIFWTKWQYFGIVTISTAWLVFALQYTGLDTRWLTRRNQRLLMIHPVLTLLLVWTNEAHRGIWQSVTVTQSGGLWFWESTYGTAFWAHTVYSYTLLFIGMLLFVKAVIQSQGSYRTQAILLLIGAMLPSLSNGLVIFGILNLPIDITAFTFLLTGMMTFWALFRHRLLDLVPIARSAVVDSISDAIVAVDLEGRILDVNKAALHMLDQEASKLLGRSLLDILPQENTLFQRYGDTLEAHAEVTLNLTGPQQWYELQISPLYDQHQELRGRLILLRDITPRKNLETSLEAQVHQINQLLEVAQKTTEDPTLNTTMQNALDLAKSMTRADTGSLILVNAEGKATHSLLTRGTIRADFRAEIVSQVLKEGLIGAVLRERQTILIHNTADDPRWVTLPDQPYQAGSALGVPIQYGEHLLGGFVLLHSTPEHFTERDAKILETAARQIGMALGNALVYEDQRRIAEQQTTLFEALRALQHPMSLVEAMSQAVTIIAQLTNWPIVALLTMDSAGATQVSAAAGQLADHITSRPLDACKMHNSETQAPADTSLFDTQCILGAVPENVLPSKLFVPLDRERALLLADDMPMAFDNDARLLAQSLGNIVALALRNAELYESVNTERQRLGALVQSSRDGILMIGKNNRILVINQTALRYLGLRGKPQDWLYLRADEALRLIRTYAPIVVRTTLAEMRRLRRGDTSASEGEFQVKGRTLHWINLPVMNQDQALGRLLILYDVTEARQVEQMREDLTHTMVHDLRNPLTSIKSTLWLMGRKGRHIKESDRERFLDIAQRSTDQLLDLVNAILDISRLESGRMILTPSRFPTHELVNDVLELQRPLANQKHIHLVTDIAQELPEVWADRGLITRVLQNLVGNALKFTPEGGMVRLAAYQPAAKGPRSYPQVRETLNLYDTVISNQALRAIRTLQTGSTQRKEETYTARDFNKIHIMVSDTGPGIPGEIKDRLFQKFVTGQQEGSGSGLGLAFCKMVLETHDQGLWVDSEPGQGATFTFTLPLAR